MFSPRLALRRLAPAALRRARDAGRRVVWTRKRRFPRVSGCLNIKFARVQELARQAEPPAAVAPPYARVAAHRMADRREVGADLVGAAGLEPHAQQRGARQRLHDLEVGDRAAGACRCASTSTVRVAAVAADRRVDRAAAASGRPVDERQVLALRPRARGSAPAARGGPPRTCATTSSPEVSRSRRWTIPGRSGSAPPARRGRPAPARASPVGGRAPGAPPRRRACRPPSGARPRSTTSNGDRPRRRPAAAPPRAPRRTRSPAAEPWRFGPRRAVDASPRPPRSAAAPPPASRRSARPRARRRAAAPASSGRRDQLDRVDRPPLEHVEQRRARPITIAMSATLNAGQAIGSMKSITAPLAHAVGQVAERAAEHQPDRQPQPAARRGCSGEVAEQQRQRDADQDGDHEPAALERAERDARVAHVREVEPEEDVRAARRGRCDATASCFVTWSSATTTAAVAMRRAPQPRPRAHASAVGSAPTTMLPTMSSTNVATIGLRSSAPGPIRTGGRKRRNRFRYGSVTS